MKITLDNLIDEVKAKEAEMGESQEVVQKIRATAKLVLAAIKNDRPITVLTDYDADGICSAYIFYKMAISINPSLKVEVICNDRREKYGVPKFVTPVENMQYIIFDTGSNEMDYITETFGEDVIVCDHHLIEDERVRDRFCNEDRLLNLHCFNEDDEMNAQYCATGLSYRIYQEVNRMILGADKIVFNEKLDNSIAIMACIGTVADVVNLMDVHGYNRMIVKNGLKRIDLATRDNIDFTIGYMLAQCGIGEEPITAKNIGFSIGAFLNSASRMSEITQTNGAKVMFDMLINGESDNRTYLMFDRLKEWNAQRKAAISALQDEKYYNTIVEERQKNNNIFLYELPENTPTAFAGLVAGKLSEATNKSVICVTYNTETKLYSGSGRNVEGADSLNEFIYTIMHTPYGKKNVEMEYGGHHDAIGLHGLNSAEKLSNLINKYQEDFTITNKDKPILDISLEEINTQETLEKIIKLEPLGEGLRLPPVVIDVPATSVAFKSMGKNPHWGSFNITDDSGNKLLTVKDWNYDEKAKSFGLKNDNYKMLVNLEVNTFKGCHIEGTVSFDRDFLEKDKELVAAKDSTVEKV